MEKHSRLIRRLLEKTRDATLSWQQGMTSNDFTVSFAAGSIRLYKEDVSDLDVDYLIDIINDNGVTVETFSDVEVDKAMENPVIPGKGRAAYLAMRELYENARRNALGSDKILASILEELEIPF